MVNKDVTIRIMNEFHFNNKWFSSVKTTDSDIVVVWFFVRQPFSPPNVTFKPFLICELVFPYPSVYLGLYKFDLPKIRRIRKRLFPSGTIPQFLRNSKSQRLQKILPFESIIDLT